MFSCPGCARNAGLSLSSILTRPCRSTTKISQRLPILAQQRTYFEEKYNPEESVRILKILNEAKTEEDLKRFIISSRRICELIKMRTESGAFKDLDDLIPIMGVKILDKFYNSMLEKKSLGLGNPMVPNLSSQNISAFSRILSITVTGNKLSWALLHREGSRLNIQSLELKLFNMTPKTHFLHLLNQITELAVSLPPCDLCITEEFATQQPSTYMFSYYLQLTQVRSMLLGYLAAKPNGPQMMSIKTVAVARLFNTYVGSEKVSGQLVVEDLFKNSPNLEMPPDLKYIYFDSDAETKECLSNVFLLNLAYWKLTSQFS